MAFAKVCNVAGGQITQKTADESQHNLKYHAEVGFAVTTGSINRGSGRNKGIVSTTAKQQEIEQEHHCAHHHDIDNQQVARRNDRHHTNELTRQERRKVGRKERSTATNHERTPTNEHG